MRGNAIIVNYSQTKLKDVGGIRDDERTISKNSCEIRFTTRESKGGGYFKDCPR